MVGFIGCGNMASAIINGMVSSGFVDAASIGVYDLLKEKTEEVSRKYGVRSFENEKALIEGCSIVVLAVKPGVFPELLRAQAESFRSSDPLIISIAAGKTTDYIAQQLPYTPRIARVMPNINAKVCQAISAYCANERATADDIHFVEGFCNSFGKGVQIKQELFSTYSAIGGCSPAFCYMFIDSLARAAVKNGMSKQQALEVAAQAMLGSAKMILEDTAHPWELVDRVCSPGGTTIEGVASLQQDGFESSIIRAVQASLDKDKRI